MRCQRKEPPSCHQGCCSGSGFHTKEPMPSALGTTGQRVGTAEGPGHRLRLHKALFLEPGEPGGSVHLPFAPRKERAEMLGDTAMRSSAILCPTSLPTSPVVCAGIQGQLHQRCGTRVPPLSSWAGTRSLQVVEAFLTATPAQLHQRPHLAPVSSSSVPETILSETLSRCLPFL